jgi:hypothetical protein
LPRAIREPMVASAGASGKGSGSKDAAQRVHRALGLDEGFPASDADHAVQVLRVQMGHDGRDRRDARAGIVRPGAVAFRPGVVQRGHQFADGAGVSVETGDFPWFDSHPVSLPRDRARTVVCPRVDTLQCGR